MSDSEHTLDAQDFPKQPMDNDKNTGTDLGKRTDTGLRGGDALMAEDGERPLMTTAEFAAHVRVSVNTVYKWIAAGEIEFVRVGPRLLRFSPDAVPKSHRQEPPTKPDDNLDKLAGLLAKVSDEHPDVPESKVLELVENETDKVDDSNVVTLASAERNE